MVRGINCMIQLSPRCQLTLQTYCQASKSAPARKKHSYISTRWELITSGELLYMNCSSTQPQLGDGLPAAHNPCISAPSSLLGAGHKEAS